MPQTVSKLTLPPIAVIFLTILIDMIGFGIVLPLLPLYSLHFGATPLQIGLLLGSFSLMQLIFAPILGRWSDRYGRRPVLFISILGTALGFLILGLADTIWLLFLGRIIDGISGGNIPTAQAYIADVTLLEKRSASMGLLGAAFGLGFMIGPAIGVILGHFSMQAPFYFATLLALINAVCIYYFLPESLPEARRAHAAAGPSTWRAMRTAWQTPLGMIMICSLLATIAFSGVTALFTLFTERRLQWSVLENGYVFAYIGFLGVLIQGGLLRRILPYTGERTLIITGTITLCFSMLLPLSGTAGLVLAASTGLAIGNGFVMPTLSGLASRSADEQSQGIILGLMQSIASLGRMLGPILGGWLLSIDDRIPANPYGITPYWAAAGLMLLAVLTAIRLRPTDHSVHLPRG